MSDNEYDDLLDFDSKPESDLGQSRKRNGVQPKQTKQTKQNTRPAPTVEELDTGLIFGPYGNGVAYDAKNARNGPTDRAAAKLSDQIYGPSETGRERANQLNNVRIEDLTKTDRARIIANAKRSGEDYVGDAHIGTFDDALKDAATVIEEREEQEFKDAANDAIAAIDENEMQEDYENLKDAIAAIEENEKQQTKKRRRGGKGRKTNTKSKSKKSKKQRKQRKQRKNKSRKSSRRNEKK